MGSIGSVDHWLGGCLAAGLAATGSAEGNGLSIFDPASPSAGSIRDLALLVCAITALIFLIVEGVLLYCTWRFRRSKSSSQNEPPQVYGSKPIEVAWTVAPALIVFTLILVTTRTLWEVQTPPPQPEADDQALFVTVVGKQWWWEFDYEHYNGRALGFITANELHVPASSEGTKRRINLFLQSADVCHSFWVPRLAGKTDLIPGVTNFMWFEPRETGLYLGQCAEYCGTQHAGMLLRVVVDTPEDFERWLAAQEGPAVAKPEAAAGQAAFLAESCVNCHRVRGTSARGSYAPDLTHLMSRQTLAAGLVPNDPENLRRWIHDPQQVKSGCLMPAFGLEAARREAIVDYLLSLE